MNELEDTAAAANFAFDATVVTLKRSTDVDACVALSARIDEHLGRTFEHFKKEGAPIACRAGCSFCCHTMRVEVIPHEAIALFRYLKSRIAAPLQQEISDRVMANAERMKGDDGHRAQGRQYAMRIPSG